MVAAFDGSYGTHWYWQDGRGNTSHITGDDAGLLERYTYDLSGAPKFYDEWGSERLGGSIYDTRFLFAGSQYLPEAGLYDMRNRIYSPALNRFLQTDPIGFAGDALNLYRYCGDDPVNRTDPMGTIDSWSGLMLWQGGGDGSVTEQLTLMYQQQQRQAAGNDSQGRPLTSGEVNMARPEYGNSINYGRVQVFKRAYFPGQPADRPMSPNGRIYYHPKDSTYRSDFSKIRTKGDLFAAGRFIHELEHVRQFQHGMSSLGLFLEHTFRGRYEYLPITKERSFEQYGIEQRATIMEDHFMLKHGYEREGQPSLQWYERVIPSGE